MQQAVPYTTQHDHMPHLQGLLLATDGEHSSSMLALIELTKCMLCCMYDKTMAAGRIHLQAQVADHPHATGSA